MKRCLLVISMIITPALCFALTTGIVTYVDGTVTHKGNRIASSNVILSIDDADLLESGARSNIFVTFMDGSQLILFENTTIQFMPSNDNQNYVISLKKGDFWVFLNRTENISQILINDVTVSSNDAAIRSTYDPADNSGTIVISSNIALVQFTKDTSNGFQSSKIHFKSGTPTSVSQEFDQIQLDSGLSQYFIPKSGEVPIVVRATFPDEMDANPDIKAFVVSSTPTISFESPLIDFYQETIEFKATALEAGQARLFVISPSTGDYPGYVGEVPLTIYRMRQSKLMKIKTARGTINIKLAPKEEF